MKQIGLILPALLALTACGDGGESADEPAAPATEAAAPAPEPIAATPPDAIPAAIRGRWGLVAADCEPGRADAKGLLTITTDKLEFYESVGTLDDVREVAPDRIHASFDFTGEGMEWEREMALELQETGSALVRREFGADAAPGSFRYVKCEQGG
jgi:hypothetical protein